MSEFCDSFCARRIGQLVCYAAVTVITILYCNKFLSYRYMRSVTSVLSWRQEDNGLSSCVGHL